MNIRRNIGNWLTISLLALAVPTAAHAHAYAGVEWLTVPTLSVIGDGKEYTQLAPYVGGAWQAEFKIESTGATRIKSWKLYPYKGSGINSPEVNLSLYAASKSYPFGNRPKNVHKTVGEIFPLSLMADYAVARCNLNLEILRGQGLSDSEILGQEHTVTMDDMVFGMEIDTTVGNAYVEGSYHEHKVICLAYDFPEPPPPVTDELVSPTFQVTGASLQVLLDGLPIPTKKERECPAELNFLGHIQVAGTAVPATVQYRFEFASGKKSNVFSTVVNHTDASALISHQVAVPLTAAFVPGSGGGGGVTPVAGGFQVQQLPDPDQPQPPPQQVSEFADTQLPGNEYKDSVRLVVLTHGGAVSGPAGYHIVCKPKVTEGIQGATGITLPAPEPEPGRVGPRSIEPALVQPESTPHTIRSMQEPEQPATRERESTEEEPVRQQLRMQQRQ